MGDRPNQVSIIGGKWRGRKINFPAVEDIRPTGAKIRETAFNWLQMSINGANCFDMFAGAGVFGFEALSRGAESVLMVDKNRKIVDALSVNQEILRAENLEIICDYIPSDNLKHKLAGQKFDIVFIDPPFRQGLVKVACDFLVDAACLANNAIIYIETEADLALSLPDAWEAIRSKQAGNVKYYLVKI